jgi:hypothetical protein
MELAWDYLLQYNLKSLVKSQEFKEQAIYQIRLLKTLSRMD